MNLIKKHFSRFKQINIIMLFLINAYIVKGVTIRDYAAILCISSSNISVVELKAEEVTSIRGWDITIVTYDAAIPQIKENLDYWISSQSNMVVFLIPAGIEQAVPIISVSNDLEAILPVSNRINIVYEAMMGDFLIVDFCSAVISGLEALLKDKILLSSLTFLDSYPIEGVSELEWRIDTQNEHGPIISSPVCYKRQDMMKLLPIFTYIGQIPSNNIKVKAVVNNQAYIVSANLMDGNIIQVLQNTPIAINVGNAVDYLPEFEITWSLSCDGGEYWEIIENTKNPLFITWDIPIFVSPVYTTFRKEFLYYGCNLAKGISGNNDQSIIDALWLPFENKNVNIVLFHPNRELKPLTYYEHPFPQFANVDIITAGQFEYDGECGAFQAIFNRVLSCQGIPCTREGVSAKENDEFFLVKNWNFLEEGTSSEEGYEYKNGVKTETIELNLTELNPETGQFVTFSDIKIYADIRREGHIYEWIGIPEVTDVIGLSAQGGTQNPYADFGVHYITMVNGKIYDPSYGNVFSNLKEWEENSVEAFFRLYEDVEIEGKWFYHIRKNTTDDEIIFE